ncbi:MAG: Hpt domain-containing protein [Saprospiraceae bacterium]|nr:Hpt domain-containing protein [Saprospiraceae bacterium]
MKINTDQLRALLGSEEAAQRFVRMFEESLPQQLRQLHESLASGDWETAGNTAHGLKSQCRYLGLNDWADTLQQIENEPQKALDAGWPALLV